MLLALAIAGCTDASHREAAPPYQSGTRLRANLLDGGGGAVLFESWHDTELGLDCDLRLATDGTWRCLPRGLTWTGFGDAACTVPIVADFQLDLDQGCAPPRFASATIRAADPCAPAGTEVYELGAPEFGTIYWVASDGTCAEFAPVSYRHLGVVDPARFVGELSHETQPRGEWLGVTEVVMEDGASQITEMSDLIRDRSCFHATLADGTSVCASLAASNDFEQVFVDDACTTPAEAWDDRVCAAHPPAAVFGRNDDHDLYLVGRALDGAVSSGLNDTCVRVPDRTAFARGRRATADDFPLMAFALRGAGDLKAQYAADHGDRLLRAEQLFDTATWTACDAVQLEGDDQPMRCLPRSGLAQVWGDDSPLFADDRCTRRVRWWSGATGDPLPEGVARMAPACAEQEQTVRSLTTIADYTGPVFESFDGGSTCVPRDRRPEDRFVIDVAAIAPDRLHALVRRTE